MSGKLTIGFNQVPRTLLAQTGKYGILKPQVTLTKAGGSVTTKDPRGFWTAINPSQESYNDSGAFSYTGGTGTISGNYSAGALPGGHTGTQKYGGVNLVLNTSAPVVNVDSTHYTTGVSFRYAWNIIEPSTAGNYVWTRLDADLAQCIALSTLYGRTVMWMPIIITKSFVGTTPSDCAPAYLESINYPTDGTTASPTAYCMGRWNTALFKPHFANLLTAIGNRYDVVPNFAGIATQETSIPAGTGSFTSFPSGTGYLDTTYVSNLKAESDAITAACPTSYHIAYQNFILNSQFGINWGDYQVDQYAAYIQGNNAILFGPDLVTGGSVVTRCYPRQLPYHNTHGGTATRAAQAGWGGGSTTFTGGGGTGLSLQHAEWFSQAPAQANTTVAAALAYGTSGTTTNIDMLMMDWQQSPGSPGGQQFNPQGVNLVKNNAVPFNTIWVP